MLKQALLLYIPKLCLTNPKHNSSCTVSAMDMNGTYNQKKKKGDRQTWTFLWTQTNSPHICLRIWPCSRPPIWIVSFSITLFSMLSLFIHGLPDTVMVIFIFTIKSRNKHRQKEGDRRACLEDKEINKAERNWAVPTYRNVSQTPSVTELI